MGKHKLFWPVTVASFGSGFQHGYHTGVLNSPEQVIREWITNQGFHEYTVTILWSTVVSIFCIGGVVGGVMSGLISNVFGRRGGLFFNNFIAFAACILMSISKLMDSVYPLVIGRLLIGINCGINAGIAPVYLSEISPTSLRGAIGSMYQLMITISIVIAVTLGMSDIMGTASLWPYLIIVAAIPALFQVLGFIFVPESPKFYLGKKNDEGKARAAMSKLAKEEDVDNRIQEIKREVEASSSAPKVTVKGLFITKKYRTPLGIICALMVAQQFSGINAVMFYSTYIFKTCHLSEKASELATIGVGVVNVITTVVSVVLVEKYGRKSLLIFAFAGMILCTAALFCCLYFVKSSVIAQVVSIIAVCLFVVFFASGAGSIPWLLGPELFDTASRPSAVSLAVPTNWFCSFIVGIGFLPLQEVIGQLVFCVFLVCQTLSLLFIVFCVPETKNKPIEEITALFE